MSVFGEINGSHTTLAEWFQDSVMRNCLPDHGGWLQPIVARSPLAKWREPLTRKPKDAERLQYARILLQCKSLFNDLLGRGGDRASAPGARTFDRLKGTAGTAGVPPAMSAQREPWTHS